MTAIEAVSARSADPTISAGRVVLFWAIALLGAAFDLGTKSYIFRWLGEPGARVPYVGRPEHPGIANQLQPRRPLGIHAGQSRTAA